MRPAFLFVFFYLIFFLFQATCHNEEIAAMDDVDTVAIVLKFPSKTIATIDVSRLATYGYDQQIEVYFTFMFYFPAFALASTFFSHDGSHCTLVACWTAGQQVKWSILYFLHLFLFSCLCCCLVLVRQPTSSPLESTCRRRDFPVFPRSWNHHSPTSWTIL